MGLQFLQLQCIQHQAPSTGFSSLETDIQTMLPFPLICKSGKMETGPSGILQAGQDVANWPTVLFSFYGEGGTVHCTILYQGESGARISEDTVGFSTVLSVDFSWQTGHLVLQILDRFLELSQSCFSQSIVYLVFPWGRGRVRPGAS